MQPREVAAWWTQYRHLIAFRREIRHRWPSPSEQFPPGNKLGAWCARQNRLFRKDRLSAQCVLRLLQTGFPLRLGTASPWGAEKEAKLRERDRLLELFLWKLGHLRRFRQAHRDRWPKRDEKFPGTHNLGEWLGRICQEYARKRLPAYKTVVLERMGVPLQGPFAQQWDAQFVQFKALLADHPEDWRHTTVGSQLYQWVARQRKKLLLGQLPPYQEKRLKALGAGFTAKDRWGDGYRRLVAYRKRHPDRWPAGRDRAPDGFLLGKWCTNQRRRRRLGKLPAEQVRKLTELGFPFQAWLQEAQWTEQFRHLEAFRARHPDRWPEKKEAFPRGNPLGKWCAFQKWDRTRGRLPARRIERLDRIGFPWEATKSLQWEQRLVDLKAWRRRHGRWPVNHAADGEEASLAAWVTHQKRLWKTGKLPETRLPKLRGLGIDGAF